MTLSYFIIQVTPLAARVQLHHLKICTANRQDQAGERALYVRCTYSMRFSSLLKQVDKRYPESSYYPSNKNPNTLSTVSLLSRVVS
jgi:hypothetical protein